MEETIETPTSEEVETEKTEGTEEQKQETRSIEDIAREWGWKPEGEKSAEDFVRAERDISRTLDNRVKWMERQMKSMAAEETKRTKAALDAQRKKLMAERDKAVEEGDTEAFRKADQEIQSLPEEPVNDRQKAFAEVEAEWAKKNAWVNENPAMQGAAVKIGQVILNESPDIEPREFYDRLEKRIREEFPHKFRNKDRDGEPDVESERPGKGQTAWSKLKGQMPEVDDYFQYFVRQGVYKDTAADREQYAREALKAK